MHIHPHQPVHIPLSPHQPKGKTKIVKDIVHFPAPGTNISTFQKIRQMLQMENGLTHAKWINNVGHLNGRSSVKTGGIFDFLTVLSAKLIYIYTLGIS